ncbi:hypothetical protein GIB67_016447 [Kingdonia uniflora]|uniref:FAS1 domain-containing protein n=1 Tax=Kingdonia uniflora TaxID=39325 RepID=A0A7J7MGZ8_9MAGN|nr:hypothetical protein GIB67_016447 [Kingdonia uniflora]
MEPSCSHWWHAPFYFAISIMLAVIAISTSYHPNTKPQTPLFSSNSSSSYPQIPHDLSSNATQALRKSGFNFIATLFQISPELFLSSSPESTIFAIEDPEISNVSLPPWLMKDLLHYHTLSSKILMKDLLEREQGSCLPTLLRGKNLALTKIGREERLVEINGVLVSHPDIFTQGSYSIHGIVKPFASFDPMEDNPGWDSIHSPICDSNLEETKTPSQNIVNITGDSRNVIPWTRILRLLSSSGFVPFAVGLRSVLDGIGHNSTGLSAVTIFAPPVFDYVSSPLPILERIVKFHILSERFTYKNLAALPKKALLRTLVTDSDLEITMGINGGEILSIKGVEITAPDVFTSNMFVIHGISRPFEMGMLSTT